MSHGRGTGNGRKGYLHSLASNLYPTSYLKKKKKRRRKEIILSFQRSLHELVAMLSAWRSLVRNYERKTLFLLVVSPSQRSNVYISVKRSWIREHSMVRNVEKKVLSPTILAIRSNLHSAVTFYGRKRRLVSTPLSTIKSQPVLYMYNTVYTVNEVRLCASIMHAIVFFNAEISPRSFSDLRKPLFFLLFANSGNPIVDHFSQYFLQTLHLQRIETQLWST